MGVRVAEWPVAGLGFGALMIGVALLSQAPQADASKPVEGPWFNAKVGTRIVYRVTDPSPVPGAKSRVRTLTEEAVAVSETEVTLRAVQRSEGMPERTNTRRVPRTISDEQYSTVFHSWGYVRASPPMKVSGYEFKCSAFVKDIDIGKDESMRRHTTTCRDLPGWIYSVTMGSDELYRILEYKP